MAGIDQAANVCVCHCHCVLQAAERLYINDLARLPTACPTINKQGTVVPDSCSLNIPFVCGPHAE